MSENNEEPPAPPAEAEAPPARSGGESDNDSASSSGSSSASSGSSKSSSSSNSKSSTAGEGTTGSSASSSSSAKGGISAGEVDPNAPFLKKPPPEFLSEEEDPTLKKMVVNFYSLMTNIPRPEELLDLYKRVYSRDDGDTEQDFEDYVKFLVLKLEEPDLALPKPNVEDLWRLHLSSAEDYAAFVTGVAKAYLEAEPAPEATAPAGIEQAATRLLDDVPEEAAADGGLSGTTGSASASLQAPMKSEVAAPAEEGNTADTAAKSVASAPGEDAAVAGEDGNKDEDVNAGETNKIHENNVEKAAPDAVEGAAGEEEKKPEEAAAPEEEKKPEEENTAADKENEPNDGDADAKGEEPTTEGGADTGDKAAADHDGTNDNKQDKSDVLSEKSARSAKSLPTKIGGGTTTAASDAAVEGNLDTTAADKMKKVSSRSGPPSVEGRAAPTPLDLVALKEALLAKNPDRLTVDELVIQMRLRLGELSEDRQEPPEEELSVDGEIRRARTTLRSAELELLELEELSGLRAEVSAQRDLEEKRSDLRSAMAALITAQQEALQRARKLVHEGATGSSCSSSASSGFGLTGSRKSAFSDRLGASSSIRSSGRSSFAVPPAKERRKFAPEDVRKRKKRLQKKLFQVLADAGTTEQRETILRTPAVELLGGICGPPEDLPGRPPASTSSNVVLKQLPSVKQVQFTLPVSTRQARTKELYAELFNGACFWFPFSDAEATREKARQQRMREEEERGVFLALSPNRSSLKMASQGGFSASSPSTAGTNRGQEHQRPAAVDFSVSPAERDELARRYLLSIEPLSKTRKIVYVPFRDVMLPSVVAPFSSSSKSSSVAQVQKMAVFSDTTVADFKNGLFYVYRDMFLGRRFDLFSASDELPWQDSRTVASYIPLAPELLQRKEEGGQEGSDVTIAGNVFSGTGSSPVRVFWLDYKDVFPVNVELPFPLLKTTATTTSSSTTTSSFSLPPIGGATPSNPSSPKTTFTPTPTVAVNEQVSRIVNSPNRFQTKLEAAKKAKLFEPFRETNFGIGATNSSSLSPNRRGTSNSGTASTQEKLYSARMQVAHDQTVSELREILRKHCLSRASSSGSVAEEAAERTELLLIDGKCMAEGDTRTLRDLYVTPKTTVQLIRIVEQRNNIPPTQQEAIENRLKARIEAIGSSRTSSRASRPEGSSTTQAQTVVLSISSSFFPNNLSERVECNELSTVFELLLLFENRLPGTAAERLNLQHPDGTDIVPSAYLGDVFPRNKSGGGPPPRAVLGLRFS
ncbi:unnamed protein product [Amoebophrya sp. A120]|nr:unnamed protein product [Amoebophrya sp. A120]|eukprot:GSA120T00024191001.1